MTQPDMTTYYDKRTPEERAAYDAALAQVRSEVAAEKANGGIVDRDFVGTHAPVQFIFVGTSMGDECDQCGAMVRPTGQAAHVTFHGLVNGVLDYNGVQA